MASFTFDHTIPAPPATVFDVLTDHRGYSKIVGPVRSVSLEREGDPAPNGVGAIRVIKAVGPDVREEVVEYVPDERFVYKALSGVPAKDHVGTVTLTETAGGTRMVYRIDTYPTIPVVVLPVIKLVVKQLAGAVAKESARRG